MKKISLLAISSILVTGCASNDVATKPSSIEGTNTSNVNIATVWLQREDAPLATPAEDEREAGINIELRDLIDSEFRKKKTQIKIGKELALQKLTFRMNETTAVKEKKMMVANLNASLKTINLSPSDYSDVEKKLVEFNYNLANKELELLLIRQQKDNEYRYREKELSIEKEYSDLQNELQTWYDYELSLLGLKNELDEKFKERERGTNESIEALSESILKVNFEEEWGKDD